MPIETYNYNDTPDGRSDTLLKTLSKLEKAINALNEIWTVTRSTLDDPEEQAKKAFDIADEVLGELEDVSD